MVKVGDVLNVEGKKVVVTYTDGFNYAFAPYKAEKKETVEEEVKPIENVEPVKEEIKPRRRRKKED